MQSKHVDSSVKVRISLLPAVVDEFHAQAKAAIYASLAPFISCGCSLDAFFAAITFGSGEISPPRLSAVL